MEQEEVATRRQHAQLHACHTATQTDADETWDANEKQWHVRQERLDSEVMMMEAQVAGLKDEAALMQEQVEHKDDALTALQHAITQAASRENARAGGAAEALSKQLVHSKVENSELSRRLKKTEQAHLEMRHLLAQHHLALPPHVHHPGAGITSMPKPLSVTFDKPNTTPRHASPQKARSFTAASMRTGVDEDRDEWDNHLSGTTLAAVVSEAQAQIAQEPHHDMRSSSDEQCQLLHKCLERSLRLQTEAEDSLLCNITDLVQALRQAAKGVSAVRGRAAHARGDSGAAGLDIENCLNSLSSAVEEAVAKKRGLLSWVSTAGLPQSINTLGPVLRKQADTMTKHRALFVRHLPLLRPAEGLAAAALASVRAEGGGHGTGHVVSRSASPGKGPKVARPVGCEAVKIKDPLSTRLTRDLKEARQKLVDVSSKHALEVERLRKHLSEARVQLSLTCVQQQSLTTLHPPELQHAPEPSANASEQTTQLLQTSTLLRARCLQLEVQVGVLEQQLIEAEHRLPQQAQHLPSCATAGAQAKEQQMPVPREQQMHASTDSLEVFIYIYIYSDIYLHPYKCKYIYICSTPSDVGWSLRLRGVPAREPHV